MDKKRLMYIDNIRLLVIIFAVIMHVAVTYSGFGEWGYKEHGQVGAVQTVIFGFYQAFVQGFAMGVMFLIAGYFIPEAYDKKGFSKFVKDRLVRLGIPTLIFMFIIGPFTEFLVLGYLFDGNNWLALYAEYIVSFQFIGSSGPLWFAFALLIFTIIYALIRKLFAAKVIVRNQEIPGFPKILALILLIGICAFLIRIVQPVGTNILNMQLCHFSSYVALFIVGLKSRRNNWFEKLDYKTGKSWLIWGLLLGFILFIAVLILGGGLEGDLTPFDGGVTWQSAAYTLWEAFVAVSMSIGLIAVFRENLNKQNRLVKTMSSNAFSVYAFHTPIIIALTLLFAPVSLIPIAKFAIASLVGVPICFLFTNYIIQKIPILRKIYA